MEKSKSICADEILAAIAEPLGVFTGIAEKDFCAGVVLGALAGPEGGAMSEDDLRKVVDWATEIRIEACALYLVLTGAVNVRVIDGELTFSRPNESPDEMGK
jgi:hypothetical protein